MVDTREDKKVRWGTVSRSDRGTEGLTDKERVHPGALKEAARRADHPEEYPGTDQEEAVWAREQLNRGPSSDYVGHDARDTEIPKDETPHAPPGTARERKTRGPGDRE